MILTMHNYQLKCLMCELTLVMRKQHMQYCHSELGNTLFSVHITTVEYVARYSYYFVFSEINITT